MQSTIRPSNNHNHNTHTPPHTHTTNTSNNHIHTHPPDFAEEHIRKAHGFTGPRRAVWAWYGTTEEGKKWLEEFERVGVFRVTPIEVLEEEGLAGVLEEAVAAAEEEEEGEMKKEKEEEEVEEEEEGGTRPLRWSVRIFEAGRKEG